jgi:hypothetical protein
MKNEYQPVGGLLISADVLEMMLSFVGHPTLVEASKLERAQLEECFVRLCRLLLCAHHGSEATNKIRLEVIQMVLGIRGRSEPPRPVVSLYLIFHTPLV